MATLTEAVEAVRNARDGGFGLLISHTGADAEDAFLADLAVGFASGVMAGGPLFGSQHTAKYNQVCIPTCRFSVI